MFPLNSTLSVWLLIGLVSAGTAGVSPSDTVSRPGLQLAWDPSGVVQVVASPGDGVAAKTVEQPVYTDVIELPWGRSAWVESEDGSGDSPLSVELARMAGRVFLRVEYRPEQQVPQKKGAAPSPLTASIRISEDPAPAQVPFASAPGMLLLSTDDPLCLECPARMEVGVPTGNGAPGDFASRRSVTSDVAWKISVYSSGLYRVTGGQLAAAGMPAHLRDTTGLRLTVRDTVVPVWTSVSGAMQSNDWIMFYGTGVDSMTTSQNVYWLSVEGPSPSMPLTNRTPLVAVPLATATWATVTFDARRIYRSLYQPLADYDNWFSMFVQGTTGSNILFATPDPVSTGTARLGFVIYGVGNLLNITNPDHRTEMLIGGVPVTGFTYSGEVRIESNTVFAASLLNHTGSTVRMVQPVVPPILSNTFRNASGAFLESMVLAYQRRLVASNLPFYFSGPAEASNLRLSGLSSTNVWLLDVTDPASPVRITGYAAVSNAGRWTIEFGHPAGAIRCYGLFPETDAPVAPSVALTRFRGLSHTNRQADYLAVTPDAYRAPLYRMLKHRFRNGLGVMVASPEDIYNEFGYGVKDPAALRQFFGYAYHHYAAPAPGYALLAGNGSYDPRNWVGQGDVDYIPVRMGPAPVSRAAFEQWFVTVDGSDNLADIKLGRIPAATTAQMARAISKIIDYEVALDDEADWYETIMLVADDNQGINFKGFSENNTRSYLEAGGFDPDFGIITGYLDDTPAGNVRSAINAELSFGIQFINYMGHGSEVKWAGEDVWNQTDALSRSNTVYPVFSVFTCENGAFHDFTNSLAEAILFSAGAGSACVAPATFAVDVNSERIADGYFAALATNRVPRLGDALQEGFFRLWTNNPAARELLFYTIIGDPAQQVWGGATP